MGLDEPLFILGVIGKGIERIAFRSVDANDISNAFVVTAGVGSSNLPVSGFNGLLLAFNPDNVHILQFFLSEQDEFASIYFRICWNTWRSWIKLKTE